MYIGMLYKLLFRWSAWRFFFLLFFLEGGFLPIRNFWKYLFKSRFILPCKSDCQPIFFKKQGTYLLYAKLWLVRPLIKNIHDSSHRYLSNVTFGTWVAFQMREEYVFWRKKYLKNWTSRGVNSGITQFQMQFTLVSRQFGALDRKLKK